MILVGFIFGGGGWGWGGGGGGRVGGVQMCLSHTVVDVTISLIPLIC